MVEMHKFPTNTFNHEGLFLSLTPPQPMWYAPLELIQCSTIP